MENKPDKKNQSSLGKWVKRSIKKFVSLTLGDSDFNASKHQMGELFFNEEFMQVIEIDFDERHLPRPKIFKLNLVVSSFFNRLKKNLRSINSIYLVYSDSLVMQFESFSHEWKDRFRHILNEEYHLELERIHYVRESDILAIFNSRRMRNQLGKPDEYFKDPYHLKSNEFLIIAGGFSNFKYDYPPLLNETKGVSTDYKSTQTIASIEVEYFKLKKGIQGEKIHINGDYPIKYQPKAGAYFYVGGEWYHNLFVPDIFHPGKSRYICFRIDDEGKYIRFFPDAENRHIPVCTKKPEKEYGSGFVKLIYLINPEYLDRSDIMDFKISICYESDEMANQTEIIETPERASDTSLQTISWEKISREIKTMETEDRAETHLGIDQEMLPFFRNEMVLLPRPGTREDDISEYVMQINTREHTIQFRASGQDNEISVLISGKNNRSYKKKISDDIRFSTIVDGHQYTFSNEIISRIQDEEMALYFCCHMESTLKQRIPLKSDFYVIGRDPVGYDNDHSIELNLTRDEFWRIGSSRNHAIIMKGRSGYELYNISTANSISIIKPESLKQPRIKSFKIPPVTEDRYLARLTSFLDEIRTGYDHRKFKELNRFSRGKTLENNDLVFIGNRIYLYVIPMVIESQLEGDIQNILKTVQLKKSIK